MNNEQIVFNILSELTGLRSDELQNIRTLNLFENGILDSLSLVRFMNELEEQLHQKIDINACQIDNFSTIDALIDLTSHL